MFRTYGIHAPLTSHRPASAAGQATRPADARREIKVTEPFMFSRLFLVTGVLLAAVALASLVSA